MFNMLDLSIELQWTVKLYTFPYKHTSLDSVALNPSDILPKQNLVGKLIFLLSALKLNYFFSINK